MKIIEDIFTYRETAPGSVITIGKFDGLHRGHQLLLHRAVEKSKETGYLSHVFAFQGKGPGLLTKSEREAYLKEAGVDLLTECGFIPEILHLEAEDFVRKILVERLHARHIVVGDDFRFGRERRGDVRLLEQLGDEMGFTVDALPTVMDGENKISSSTIRQLLAEGRMEHVNRLLGYPFSVTGEVVHGKALGRTIGVPTANMIPESTKALPPNGVYYVEVLLGEEMHFGMANIGTKPTVDGSFLGIETYLFDFDRDIYGETITVQLLNFARPEQKFESFEQLTQQLRRDEEIGRRYFHLP